MSYKNPVKTSLISTNNNVSSLSREPEENILKQRNRESISSATTITIDLPVPTAIDVKDTDQGSLPESISNFSVNSTAKKSARFEAAHAEAELDMLLDSFGETKFFETSSVTKRSNNLSYVQQEDASQLGPAKSLNNVMNHAKRPAHIDTSFDNLLEETSILININDMTLPLDVNAAPHSTNSSLDPTLKSKLLDDLDSWLDTI